MKPGIQIAAAVLAALLVSAVCASAQVPAKINYQVMLTNNSDQPLSDQAVSLVFRLYSHEVGGGELWHETHDTSTNSVGVVSVTLGDIVTLSTALFDDPVWLQVEVGGQILIPRRELVSAPYSLYSHDSYMLGSELPEAYVLDGDLATPGTINSPSNPVDWTVLKNVPDGFADGADDVGGAGDGHSLDADDGSPTDAVYVDADGNIGIGVTAPVNRLTMGDAGRGDNYLHFVNATTGPTDSDGLEIGVDTAGDAYLNQQEALALNFLTGGELRGYIGDDGVSHLGGGSSNGRVDIHLSGSPAVSQIVATAAASGGELYLNDETGAIHTSIQPDVAGTGGFLSVADGRGGSAFDVDGNHASTSSGAVMISGSSSSTSFITANTGDESVNLPANAVSSPEILDEPGVSGSDVATMFDLTGGPEPDILLSATITVPGPGYVLAMAVAEAEADRIGGAVSAYFGLSSVNSFMEQELLYGESDGTSSGPWNPVVSVHMLFAVGAAGPHTFYFQGDQVVGTWRVVERDLTLVYFPTDYGAVARASASSPAGPLTEADIASERAEAVAANDARIARELAEIEARLAEIRSQFGNRSGQ